MKTEFFGVAPLLQVFDMPIALRFYRDVLGFAVLHQSQEGDDADWCHLSRGGTEIMLNTMYERENRPSQPDIARSAAHSDTGLFFACRDLDGAYQHLRSHGIDLQPPRVAPYGMRQLWFRDPDGYGLCFQWPSNERWAEDWRKRYGFAA
ncbi:MAG TPA: VOC family protein [Bryobacteraceae bacterium]|jgi:catechol 2,3-dioxygenase-like lactoylglutathione lyase family enzyme|nr:VOC family protein [Bryobacteraceae bacterium]